MTDTFKGEGSEESSMKGQRTLSMDSLNEFPPTVVGHTNYDDGVDLELLDSGTQDEPRLIRIYDDAEMEAYL